MRFTVVTASFNQGAYLEAAIRSVLEQTHPNVEYAILDGGSTDGSVEIIKRYAERLAYWRSRPDDGQYAAITEGFSQTSGEVMCWLNSDDVLCPWALAVAEEIFTQLPEVQWLTSLRPLRIDRTGKVVRCLVADGYSKAAFFDGENLPGFNQTHSGWIQQESTFWRRELWERAGAQVGSGYPLAGDFELWARFFAVSEIHGVEVPLGGFRFHPGQRSDRFRHEYRAEAEKALLEHGGKRRSQTREIMRSALLRMPKRAREFAARSGVLYESKVCRHSRETDQWRVEKVYA